MEPRWETWREATERALYGDGGFYRRTEVRPAGHFRTSVHASPLFAGTVLSLMRSTGLTTLVDVGAGGGELLLAMHRLDPALRLVGVEVAPRPAELPAAVEWADRLPSSVEGLLFANEWLDNVPVDVVELAPDGPRLVEVSGRGEERLGRRPEARDLEWLQRWWPLHEVGDRAEVGHPRDEQWARAIRSLRHGVAVAADYSHGLSARPAFGTLAGYRHGRQVQPVPDGTCDVTSAVALDACAAAGETAGATATLLTSQREALRALGLRRSRPAYELAHTRPQAYVQALAEQGAAAELTATDGLGDFGWLVQTVDTALPEPLAQLATSGG